MTSRVYYKDNEHSSVYSGLAFNTSQSILHDFILNVNYLNDTMMNIFEM